MWENCFFESAFMILIWLILIPLLGGLAAWIIGNRNANLSRWISLAALALDLVLLASLWSDPSSMAAITNGTWLLDRKWDWIPQLGISLHLAMDGLSLLLVALTLFLGIISVICSWTEVRERVGFFHLNLTAILAGILGVFLSLDLFLFYFFWELMLVPMYFLISIWGHENRVYASLKFFIFTQAGGLLMLLSILGLYFIHGRSTGVYTFDYSLLLGTVMAPKAAFWIMLGFFISFTVKLPMVPFHPWLPDAHTEAPTAGSVILAGLLLKTGAYGLLRFVLPLFPEAARSIAPVVMIIAVIGIIYGAVLAFAQTDLKRLVAYTSVSHMGFVLLGIFALNITATQGAIMQMLCPRREHRRFVPRRRHGPGTHPHPRYGAHGRVLVHGTPPERRGHGLRSGLARTAGLRKLRGRVHGAPRRLPGERFRDRICGSGARIRSDLFSLDGSARFPRWTA